MYSCKNSPSIFAIFALIITIVSSVQSEECELENRMISKGLIDIAAKDSSICVEIINATSRNMLGVNMYGCLDKCYLQPQAVEKVVLAQRILKQNHPGYSLKVLEGTRPRRVQKKMFDSVKNTSLQKFVADPIKGSMHNFGAAIDVTIIDPDGRELDMGKPDPRMVLTGKSEGEIKMFFAFNRLSKQQKQNRELLKGIMLKAGFIPVSYEWWHFDAFEKGYIRNTFSIIE
jgi:D-alanyl-D-alanine dipeptidase